LNANNFTFNHHGDEKVESINNSNLNVNTTQDTIYIQSHDLKESVVNPILDQLHFINNNTNAIINENKLQNQNIYNNADMISKLHSQYESLINMNNMNINKDQNFTDTIRNLSKINNENIDESIAITEYREDYKAYPLSLNDNEIKFEDEKNILMLIMNKIDNLHDTFNIKSSYVKADNHSITHNDSIINLKQDKCDDATINYEDSRDVLVKLDSDNYKSNENDNDKNISEKQNQDIN